jgi:hypothetical protein
LQRYQHYIDCEEPTDPIAFFKDVDRFIICWPSTWRKLEANRMFNDSLEAEDVDCALDKERAEIGFEISVRRLVSRQQESGIKMADYLKTAMPQPGDSAEYYEAARFMVAFHSGCLTAIRTLLGARARAVFKDNPLEYLCLIQILPKLPDWVGLRYGEIQGMWSRTAKFLADE